MLMQRKFDDGALNPVERQVVSEFPLRLLVNGQELATLVASQHQLNYLIAGFCRMQGLVQGLGGYSFFRQICQEFGAAHVRLRGKIPERLQPILTSSCGSGIVFGPLRFLKNRQGIIASIATEAVIELMQRPSLSNRRPGGIRRPVRRHDSNRSA